MNYCPETVLLQSAFLLADKEAVQSLNAVGKDKCSRVVNIVSDTIREITREALHEDPRRLLQVEVRELEFKIHSWVFSSLLKRYGAFDFGESPEEDYFDSFPPLPQFGINFYLELVHELGWGELLAECLCAVGIESITPLLEEIINGLVQEPSYKDLSLFLCLFNSLLVTGKQNSPSDNQDREMDNAPMAQSSLLLLLQGAASLTKYYINWPDAQMDIIKGVIDFTIKSVVDLNFRKHSNDKNKDFLSKNKLSQNSVSDMSRLHTLEENKLTEGTAPLKSEHDDHAMGETQEPNTFSLAASAEVRACIDFLCRVFIQDWRVMLHCIYSEEYSSGGGKIDCSSWSPLHKWIIKLYAVACWLVSHSQDSKLLDKASKLQHCLAWYAKTYFTNTEVSWVDSFKNGELVDEVESCVREEFSPLTDSVDLLLFQPETAEEQFFFYLQRVSGRLEGYKECFDWLLSAEEFHGEPDWLDCMRNHAVQLSDIQHALKMVDIIYMQRQLLCSDEESTDSVYRDIKKILLSLYSTFPCTAQEQIIEYAFFMSLTLECSEDDSVFFHPHFITQERTALQQELVMIFNKLIDISSEGQLQSAMKDLAREFLISPDLTLTKAVHEGVKSAGHLKGIYSLLEKFPAVCGLRYNGSASSQTLLCKAVTSVTVSVSSRQQENNLLNMLTMLLSSGSSASSPLLSVQEFIEATVLPFLNHANMQGDIPTVLALKLLNISMVVVKRSVSLHLQFLKKHLLPIILCLCELLNECNVFWDGLAPVHSLSEMEELRELVIKALDTGSKLCCDILEMDSSFARAVEWLSKRLRSGFDWTAPLHLEKLFSAAYIKYKLPVPHCLLNVCEDLGEEWVADKNLVYGPEDVFTVLFEYCRVSESSLQRSLESYIPNKLAECVQDIKRKVVAGLVQILPHCTWKEWKRILDMCRHLIGKNILQVDVKVSRKSVPSCFQENKVSGVYQLSALLLDMMEVLHSPLCSSWATPHVWLYMIKHYITAVKEMVDLTTDAVITAQVFAHVCHVMTLVPPDCRDQLFVLTLDLVARPAVSNDDVCEQLKLSINSLSSEVYKAALMQKRFQNM